MESYYKMTIMIFVFIFCSFFLTSPAKCQQWYPIGLNGYWQPQYNQPYPNFSSRIWTNPFTSYSPYQYQMTFTNNSAGWQLPYLQQNNLYQIATYGNVNLNNLASSHLVSAYSRENNINNPSYYNSNYGYVLPYGSGPSTYFHLLPPNYIMNYDPYTLAQQAKQTTSNSTPDYNKTLIGRVVESNSLDVNGTIIRCWENNSPVEAVGALPLDLSSYMGMMVEVTGDLWGGNSLYSASFDGVIK